jgi:hypothetical protein
MLLPLFYSTCNFIFLIIWLRLCKESLGYTRWKAKEFQLMPIHQEYWETLGALNNTRRHQIVSRSVEQHGSVVHNIENVKT